MTDDLLVFNGVDGMTGTYGLRPKTPAELASHIRGGPSTELPIPDELQRNRAKKVAAIVRFLAESSLQPGTRDAAWQSTWLGELTELLATHLLGAGYRVPDAVSRLRAKVERHTAARVERIAELLAQDRTRELIEYLLERPDAAPDNNPTLRKQLKEGTRSQISEVRQRLLDPSRAADLEGGLTAQRAWLEDLRAGLDLIPITALNTLETRKIRPRESLLAALEAEINASAAPHPWLTSLYQAMQGLPQSAAWETVVQSLCDGLQALIDDQDGQVSWSPVLDVLSRWLVALPPSDLGVIEGVDATKLEEAGWGVIFPAEDPLRPTSVAAIKEKLRPLLDLRQAQANDRFHIYDGDQGYHPDETAASFAARHNARLADPADPEKLPYYLLIIGSPEEIPFHFQYQLDVQYAVGRIDFGDDLEAYGSYARSVVAAETGRVSLAPRAAFFAPANPGDTATRNSSDRLVEPLYSRLKERYAPDWQIEASLREAAVKSQLLSLMGGDATPALLFAACHGLEFDKESSERQVEYQGALLCQEWKGPVAGQGQVPRDHYVAGEDLVDLRDDANLVGQIAFFFACFSAGTPRFDEYSKQAFRETALTITDHPFVAALPKAMLSLPKGGALAIVGHVERAWGTSFLGHRQSTQIAVFASAIEGLLAGKPLGLAMEYFDGRYAALSTELTAALESAAVGMHIDDYKLAELWTANNDARGYIVIGDPAVRLCVAESASAATGRRDVREV